MARYDSYVICTSPRSGSTLLCKLLKATSIAGRPESYFHRPSVADWWAALGRPADAAPPGREGLRAVFQAVLATGRGGTEMFGLRLQRHSFAFFTEQLALLHPARPTDAERLQAAFGRTLFVHLTRTDKVDQAISLVKAEQSGLWHVAQDGTELERVAPHAEPVFDADAIRAALDTVTAYDRDWDDWFEREAIAPLRITYDALSTDPADTLRDLLDHLGLDRDAATGIRPGVKKLADRTSREWAERFRAAAPHDAASDRRP